MGTSLQLQLGQVVIPRITQIGSHAKIQVSPARNMRHGHRRLHPVQSRTVPDLDDVCVDILKGNNLVVRDQPLK